MTSWHTYPKIYNLGHRAIADIFMDDVLVEEKVDGSQFSFGIFDGNLRARSRGMELDLNANGHGMFDAAVKVVREVGPLLRDGWTYRGEYLRVPNHNTLTYNRIPTQHIILFDINTAEETYLPRAEKEEEAKRLGFECVPLMASGKIASLAAFEALLASVSVLGGQKIEGVVVKNYARFGTDKKVLLGKFVSEAFKEAHTGSWREKNPTGGDIVDTIGAKHCTPARWQKAIQHLAEAGKLEGNLRDIGTLIREIQSDFAVECSDEVKEALWKWAHRRLTSGVVKGFPEWYKRQLLEKSEFPGEENA